MSDLSDPRTRNETVFQRIREDILSGHLTPGSRLRFAEMCARYDTSVGVVREALSRIVEQGFVTSEPQIGFSVVPVSPQDLLELTEIRCHVEGLTLRKSVEEGNLAWESSVVAVHYQMCRTPTHLGSDPTRLNEAWGAVHKQFHTTLLAGCTNERLKAMSMSLRDSAEFYRRAGLRPADKASGRDVVAEHQALLDAAVARDADAAEQALVHHIRATTDYLLQVGTIFANQTSQKKLAES